MNHDASHCSDYKKSCPKKCYRARLTKEFLEGGYDFPVSFVHFKDTKYCQKRNNRINRKIKEALTMKISGILIDVSSYPGSVKEHTLEEMSLDDFYKALNCSTIDICQREIDGKVYDIVCDDNGLLMENPVVTALNKKGETMLVGNLFVCNHEGAHLSSLSKEDVLHIMMNVAVCVFRDSKDDKKFIVSPAINNVEYVGYVG